MNNDDKRQILLEKLEMTSEKDGINKLRVAVHSNSGSHYKLIFMFYKKFLFINCIWVVDLLYIIQMNGYCGIQSPMNISNPKKSKSLNQFTAIKKLYTKI